MTTPGIATACAVMEDAGVERPNRSYRELRIVIEYVAAIRYADGRKR